MMGVGLTQLQSPGPPGAKVLYGLLLILAVSLALRIVFFLGLCVADDFAYCGFVNKILAEEPYFTSESEFRSLRWPVILPVVLSFWMFGQSEVAAVWGSFVYSLGGILVLFLIGRRLFGDRVGLYSAMLLAVFPGDVLYATKLMPDIAISFYMGLAVLFFIEGEAAPDRRRAMWLYGLCGLAMFGAFRCRVTAVYFFLFFLVFSFSGHRLKRGVWLIFGAFGLSLGLLYLFYAIKTGNPFYELSLLEKIKASAVGYIKPPEFTRNLAFMIPIIKTQVVRMDLYAFYSRIPLASLYLLGFFYYFIIPAFFYWSFRVWKDAKRDEALGGVRNPSEAYWFRFLEDTPPLLIPLVWLFIVYMCGEYGTISLSKYEQLRKQPRFLLIQTMPGILLVALLADRMISEWRAHPIRNVSGVVMVLFLLLTSIGITQKEAAKSLKHIAPYRETYDLLKGRPLKDLFLTEGWWPLRMSHYLGRENGYRDPPGGPGNRLRHLKSTNDIRDIRDAYAVVDRNPFEGVGDFKFGYSSYPPFVKRTPPHWQKLGGSHNVEVYYAPQEIPDEIVASYADTASGPVPDFSTWEGSRSALEQAMRDRDFELFKSCLRKEFKSSYSDAQLRKLFTSLLKSQTPEMISRLEQRHFIQEDGKWLPLISVKQ